MDYKLLKAFESLFVGQPYLHRNSTQGDYVASFIVDDLRALGRSPKLNVAVDTGDLVLNTANKTVGLKHRRGDGTFGTIVPGETPSKISAYIVSIGEVANIHLGAEVKILAKAMIKQLDRVGSDMENQAQEFRKHGSEPICVGIVAVNYAQSYTSFEGERAWPTDGKKHKHPNQEAAAAEGRLLSRISGKFDEIVCLRFIATNVEPFPFAWLDASETKKQYGAALVRISAYFERRL
ncbi:hypothetical protein [Ideonella sp.]|uniref:hypothetical protein n=1 Tax=Ideonella sp. TaxID=1929293 RepID=UPI0035B09AE4